MPSAGMGSILCDICFQQRVKDVLTRRESSWALFWILQGLAQGLGAGDPLPESQFPI